MSWLLYAVAGLLAAVVLIIVVQFNRKSVYGRVVYQELENMPEGRELKARLQSRPEEVRMKVAMMQVQLLRRAYERNLAPTLAARAMVGAVNEWLDQE